MRAGGQHEAAFARSDRFELIGELGQGGMGVVYEVLDRARGHHVALKTLRRLRHDDLAGLKREFRAVADISHPNLVALYELFAADDHGYFTMELVRGCQLLEFVRPGGGAREKESVPTLNAAGPSLDLLYTEVGIAPKATPEPEPPVLDPNETLATLAAPTGGAGAVRGADPVRPEAFRECDEQRLRDSLAAIARGLGALHRIGVVHRDLKPSNVMVGRDGRVVLLDFGIVAERGFEVGRVEGTPAYMAPEQAGDDAVDEAADWYAFGAVMYRLINDRAPFLGSLDTILGQKRSGAALRELPWAEGVSEDLRELASGLLDPDPGRRPTGAEVRALLRGAGSTSMQVAVELAADDEELFVGRGLELASLATALDNSRAGTRLAIVRGPSGVGKSSLVHRFLAQVRQSPSPEPPLVLCGRCHERETLPYKGFDGVADGLAAWFREHPLAAGDALTPGDARALGRLFPSLREVVQSREGGASVGASAASSTDHQPGAGGDGDDTELAVLRARGFSGLRHALGVVARDRRVVVWVDDLQWADSDSIELLGQLAAGDNAGPGPLLLVTRRIERAPIDAELEEILQAREEQVTDIELKPLTRSEESELLSQLLGESQVSQELSEHFFAESGGIPLFLLELARFAARRGAAAVQARPTFAQALQSRVGALAEAAQRLLAAVIHAGEPTRADVLARAAGVDGDARERAMAVLRAERLARLSTRGTARWLDTYHDRIREVLVEATDAAESRQLHRQLAEALAAGGDSPPDRLARHWLAAGDPREATRYFLLAARAATEQLAFERAAESYKAVLEHAELSDAARCELWAALASALASAGRGWEAAGAYREAATLASPDEAQTCRERAAEQLLRAGNIVEGIDALHDVLRYIGVKLPRTPLRALPGLLGRRAIGALRGIRWRRREQPLASAQAHRIDLLTSLAVELGYVDLLRGAYMGELSLQGALSSGDPARAARALFNWVMLREAEGLIHNRRVARAHELARQLALDVGTPYLRGWGDTTSGWARLFRGEFRASLPHLVRAERTFGAECVGAEWERTTAWYGVTQGLMYSGELEALDEHTDYYLREASLSRNAYARCILHGEPSVWSMLRRDRPKVALARLDEVLTGWPADQFTLAHWRESVARTLVCLYQKRHDEALELASRAARRAGVLRLIPSVEVSIMMVLGASAAHVGDLRWLRRALRRAARQARVIPAFTGLATALRGLVAWHRGNPDKACRLVLRGAEELEAVNMAPQLSSGFRYAVGHVLGGTEGARLIDGALARLEAAGARRPRRMVEMFAPAPMCRARR